MTAAELAALEETEQSYGESMGVDRSSSRRPASPSRAGSVAHEAAPAAATEAPATEEPKVEAPPAAPQVAAAA